MDEILKAFAARASISELLQLVAFGVLIWMLREERLGRASDRDAHQKQLAQRAEIEAEREGKHAAAMERMADSLTMLRDFVAAVLRK